LGVITVFVFVWAVTLSLNDTSINNADFASTNVKPLNAQLTVDSGNKEAIEPCSSSNWRKR
jgi:hypothetical protein